MGDKLSTDEILAAIRGGSSSSPSDAVSASEPAPPVEEASAGAAPAETPKAPSPAPTGTGGILDSIRSGGVESKPATGKAPSSTADILAAAKAGGAGAAKSAGVAPKGTASILDAVRGGGGGAAAPAGAKKKSTSAAPAIDKAAVSGLSAAEIIQAARAGQSPDEAELKPVALPSRPLKPKVIVKAADPTRRGFLGEFVAWITAPVVIAWTAFTATLTIASLGTARFMMPNVLVEPPTKFKIGPPTDYSPGTVSTKWKAQFGVWIVNAEVDGAPMLYALSTVCTHLGCTPNWLEGEQKFKCPCHGSGFRKTGVNFEGPAPRPLERMGIRLAPDGMLEVDKSVKFQQELGQWENPASYVPVV
jgi:cytochrome b6-f complex iron-sulfur subunit